MSREIRQLFRQAPQFDMDHCNYRDAAVLRLMQRTDMGHSIDANIEIPRFMIVDNMPPREVLNRLNQFLARELMKTYTEFLEIHPYV